MPELPEVETIRRQLEPSVVGRRIVEANILDHRWCLPRDPREVEAEIEGRAIVSLSRRGKYLLMELEGERFLVMHLRMTGNLLRWPADVDAPVPPYLRVRLALDGGDQMLFVDLRRFGTGAVVDGRDSLEGYLS
jgi:formamidopyrimidine-DNA glycosylase